MLDPFLLRLLIGALIIFIFQMFFGILPIEERVKGTLNVILIIGVILYIVFGSFIPFAR